MPAIVSAERGGGGNVDVLYAGSLVNLMERGIGPAFAATGHGRFRGYAGGSNKVAAEIKAQLRHGDVFISANPRVNDDMLGSANGDWVSWYVTFAQSPLVIGYDPQSRFADELRRRPWYEVLREKGIRIGRTDPKLDPKGKLTVALLDHAAQVYKLPDLSHEVLGAAENPAQVLPEESMVGRLQSGQLDVGFFYSTETTDLKIPVIQIPVETAVSAHYTATILRDAANPVGAADFIAFLLGPQGRRIMRQHGLDLVTAEVNGDAAQMPAGLRSFITTAR